MEKIYSGQHEVLYNRLNFFDVEEATDAPSAPDEIEPKTCIFYDRGVTVGLPDDSNVEVSIFQTDEEPSQQDLIGSHDLTIGSKGAIVGNANADDLASVKIPAGKYKLYVYLTE